ncbi:hypothetical protein [Arthrobacter sp. 3Tela_A]|uniref:hypothetical protein n=1 Tax=Arthrobacter sp. 3Tela_A TaxID=3093743 RepID=UPI003BB63B7C
MTVTLGIGAPAAYALWSASASVNLQVRTAAPPGPTLPPGTSLISAQTAYADRPGAVSGLTCAPLLSHQQMMSNNFADVRFFWPAATGATSYVITVRNNTGKYSYDRSQTVTSPEAVYRFERQKSQKNGDAQTGATPFYSLYTVRVLPMKNGVPGDPVYRTYQYEHHNGSNCHEGDSGAAAPTGSIAPLTCSPVAWDTSTAYSELALSWPRAANATRYAVTVRSQNGTAGVEATVTGNTAAIRIVPKPAGPQFLGKYTVRIQPMNGAVAGDPVYRTYQLGQNSHECW